MPFDEEDNDQPSIHSQKIGLKKVSTQESIFDSMPKKPTPEEHSQNVRRIQEKSSVHKRRAAELAVQYHKVMSDKTIPSNKNSFQKDLELELLKEMINFATDVNNSRDEEKDGVGSVSLIALMLKNSISQRDRINNLEYALSQLEKKTDPKILNDLVSKEITKSLDNKK